MTRLLNFCRNFTGNPNRKQFHARSLWSRTGEHSRPGAVLDRRSEEAESEQLRSRGVGGARGRRLGR